MKKTIDEAIQKVLSTLEETKVGTPEYDAATKNLETLCNARSYKNERSIPLEIVVSSAISIAEILLVLYFERFNVIGSKAFNWIRRVK